MAGRRQVDFKSVISASANRYSDFSDCFDVWFKDVSPWLPLSVPGLEPSARSEVESAESVFLVGEEGEEFLGLSDSSLSRLRSPSMMEVREKGNERLKEELAKAQRVRL